MPIPPPAPGLPLALLLAAASPPTLQTCPVPVAEAVETAEAGACMIKHCASPMPDLSVCRCIGGSPPQAPTAAYTVRRGTGERHWSVTLDDRIPDQMGAMDVALADLSGTGTPSLVIAELAAVSNGVGIHSWTLTILEAQPPFRTLATAETVEYGPGTLARRPDGETGCDLLIVTPEDVCRTGETAGVVLSGQWMRLRADGLRPLGSRPRPSNRYVDAADLSDDRGQPAVWFSAPGPGRICPAGSR
ncbi:hypothetical protein [Azospirillum sp. B510]|uniref:hypothetical protein n=1 Tax=Azospirillum sp. (strain B510) TaxID=137722 RepID=UPI0005AA2E7D|nr:hypothetical protein [Azospirillum sp. B510]